MRGVTNELFSEDWKIQWPWTNFPSDMAQDLARIDFSKWHGPGLGKSKLPMYLAPNLAWTNFPSGMAQDLEKSKFSMYLAQDLVRKNFLSNMAQDLERENFPCTWPKTWPRTNFLNIWLKNWPNAKVSKYNQETGQKQKFMDTSHSTS